MYNGNPHAPTGDWLHSIAGPGGYEESEVGDRGDDMFQRGEAAFKVTVERVE